MCTCVRKRRYIVECIQHWSYLCTGESACNHIHAWILVQYMQTQCSACHCCCIAENATKAAFLLLLPPKGLVSRLAVVQLGKGFACTTASLATNSLAVNRRRMLLMCRSFLSFAQWQMQYQHNCGWQCVWQQSEAIHHAHSLPHVQAS
jgi:hypothetical protein